MSARLSRQVHVTFNERSFEDFEDLKRLSGSSSFKEAAVKSIQLMRALQKQALAGYDTIEVVNRKGKRRELVTKSLVRNKKQ